MARRAVGWQVLAQQPMVGGGHLRQGSAAAMLCGTAPSLLATCAPTRVGVHDFPDPEMPKAIPHGVYEIGGKEGWVNVGDDHDTPAFAVASVERWWERMGRAVARTPPA